MGADGKALPLPPPLPPALRRAIDALRDRHLGHGHGGTLEERRAAELEAAAKKAAEAAAEASKASPGGKRPKSPGKMSLLFGGGTADIGAIAASLPVARESSSRRATPETSAPGTPGIPGAATLAGASQKHRPGTTYRRDSKGLLVVEPPAASILPSVWG